MWELWAYRQGIDLQQHDAGRRARAVLRGVSADDTSSTGLRLALLLVRRTIAGFGLPVLLVYGIIRGLDQATPDVILPQFIGALLGRYYFAKRFGEKWPQYSVVFFAGYGCGVGLIMMLSLGIVFMSKSVFQSPY